jgi:putative transposase
METQPAAIAAPQPTRDDPTIWRVDDALWAELQPLLVVDKPRKKPGRKRNDDRPILDGLIWLARTGAQWKAWPREQFGPKSTAHDRLQEWVEYGCLERAWARLLAEYDGELGLQWEWLAADGCIVKAPLGKKGAAARPRRPGATPPTAGYPLAGGAARSGTC